VARASAKDFHLQATPDEADPLAPNERIETFLFGWICELHGGGWSVLDRQFQSRPSGPTAQFLARCAGVQALYEIAGGASSHKAVLERLSGYGITQREPLSRAWFELFELAAGAKTSRWRDEWQTLDEAGKKASQAEMASELAEVFEFLAKMPSTSEFTFMGYLGRRSELRKIWCHPLAREESARMVRAVMDDETGLFATAEISAAERARLLIGIFDWREIKEQIESRFEGKEKRDLLTELALGGQVGRASGDQFLDFTGNLAAQIPSDRAEASRLWLKVASGRAAAGDLDGARDAREKIQPAHLKEYELSNLNYQIERLAAAAKAVGNDEKD
jgi:hypothetical protein